MAEFKKEIERLTERIAAERRRIQSQAQRPAPNFQNILAARRLALAAMRNGSRAASRPNRWPLLFARKCGSRIGHVAATGRTQLTAVQRNGFWTVGTWPNGAKHYVAAMQSVAKQRNGSPNTTR
jgi:hypothetical protein